jgi:hypothetical protein
VLLVVVLALLAGLSWLGAALLTGRFDGEQSGAPTSSPSRTVVRTPALERVAPSVTALRTPTPPPVDGAVVRAGSSSSPAAGAPCTDEMLGLAVRAPKAVAIGSKPTIELVVQNTSRVPCVRPLDKALQEVVLIDGRGTRLWGSNDCLPEAGPDTRTLAPGRAVSFPLVWSGLTSEPTCTAERVPPPAGDYVLRGRLDTKTTRDTPISLR